MKETKEIWWRLFLKKLPLETETTQFILVNLIDFFMTYILLRSGQFREANPIAAYFLYSYGPIKGMLYFKLSLVLFVCMISQIVATQSLVKAQWLLRFGTLVVTGVVIYSLIIYLKGTHVL